MASSPILVTIITSVYNGEEFIENAIKSVLYQDYLNIEYIIIDGGSKDKTVSIIEKYKSKLHYWISEPDNGIGDAWNKGIKKANGQLIGLLNADDMYHKTAVTNAVEAYRSFGNDTLLYGVCKFILNNSIFATNNKYFDPTNLIRGFSFVHTTCFLPKEVYNRVGMFNDKFKIAVDGEFLLRCYLAGVKFEQTSITTYMQVGGVSDKKAKEGYFEYLDLLFEKKIISLFQLSRQKLIYNTYYPFRGFFKSPSLRHILRQCKHLLVWGMNMLYRFIPTFTLKNAMLRFIDIKLGKATYIYPKTILYRKGNLQIGDYSVINPDSILDNRNKIVIGNCVSISHGVRIYTNGHDITSPYADMVGKSVEIEDYALIFANVMIMPGVKIGRGAVIYPGSVITKNVEPMTVVGGNPAKKIKMRENLLLYKNDYGFIGVLS